MTKMQKDFPSVEKLRHVHIVGVCGTLMGAFAAFLRRSGVRVTGSDQNVYPPMSDVLAQAGVELMTGYRAENLSTLPDRPDLVVIGNVIRGDNPEARFAVDQGYAYTSLPEAMGELYLRNTKNLVIAGTHGKTTTSSLLAFTLVEAGLAPSYFLGGVVPDLPYSFHIEKSGRGPFVLEGDEYDTAFWDKVPKYFHYRPDETVLTSVEFDHADIYSDIAAVERAFDGLGERIRPGGSLIYCQDFPRAVQVAERAREKRGAEVQLISYGLHPAAEYQVRNVKTDSTAMTFDIFHQGKIVEAGMRLALPGAYNAANALSAWIICDRIGVPRAKVRAAFEKFKGVRRRQEVRGVVGGVTVIDDFAHHPTAVRETLTALAQKYKGHRLVAVFEPRSATSRRKIFQNEYGLAFDAADSVFVAKPYDQSRISSGDQFSTEELIETLRSRGRNAEILAPGDEAPAQVRGSLRSGDIVAVLSNGGFGGFIAKLLNLL